MLGIVILSLAVETAAAAPAAAALNPRAVEPFQRDWVLMEWALRFHDRDRDGDLSLPEANAAANALKEMADGDNDGRVTTYEYDRAREFILARY